MPECELCLFTRCSACASLAPASSATPRCPSELEGWSRAFRNNALPQDANSHVHALRCQTLVSRKRRKLYVAIKRRRPLD